MVNWRKFETDLTAGSARALQRAAAFAAEQNQPEVGLPHVLLGLLADESQAQEILLAKGITEPAVMTGCLGFEVDPTAPSNATSPTETSVEQIVDAISADLTGFVDSAETLELDIETQTVITRAKGIAARSRLDEIASDHLLAALVEHPSSVANFLKSAGVLNDNQQPAEPADVPPLPVEFEIELNRSTSVDHASVFRIMDASANRSREGLRVVEDYCRFVWDDSFLCEQLKTVRHELAAALQTLNADEWIRFRDTQQDVGTQISTQAEHSRGSNFDVVVASLKRIEEAFRSLEEYSKLIELNPTPAISSPSHCIEQLRYRVYTIEKAIITRDQNAANFAARSLYLLLSRSACQLPLDEVIVSAIEGGVSIIQIREKELSDHELLEHARHVRQLTRDQDVLLIMNDRPDLAVLCEADGVHVGQDELSVQDVRQIVGPRMLVGVSTHSIEQARQAVLDGADYIGVGPVFPSKTKSFDSFAGLELVRQVSSELSIPAFPIGGLSTENVQELRQTGANRMAVSNCICSSRTPNEIARQLNQALQANVAVGH
jgi:thiamine-phosphate pyrophosphorylase